MCKGVKYLYFYLFHVLSFLFDFFQILIFHYCYYLICLFLLLIRLLIFVFFLFYFHNLFYFLLIYLVSATQNLIISYKVSFTDCSNRIISGTNLPYYDIIIFVVLIFNKGCYYLLLNKSL